MHEPTLLVLDEEEALRLQVERVVADLRPRPTVTWCDGFEAVGQALDDGARFDVVIAGPLACKEQGFHQLAELRGRLPDMALLLAVDRWRTASLRDTVRTRALDVLRLPVADDELRGALQQAIASGGPTPRAADRLTGATGAAARGPGDGDGRVVAVVSATGGCGKTFFATNLAFHLQSTMAKTTCLIDMDLQFGELSTALRLKPQYTIRDLVSKDAGDDLSGRFVEHLQQHESGLQILAAPEEPADADAIDADDLAHVIGAAQANFDYVIVDTPSALSDSVMVPVEHADAIFVLATLDLPSVRNLGVLLSTFKKLRVPPERIRLVLNKVEPKSGMDVSRVERYFPQGFSMVIPYGREVNRSLNMGQPLLAYAPRGEVSKAMAAGFTSALVARDSGHDGDEPAAPAAKTPIRPRRRFAAWRTKKPA